MTKDVLDKVFIPYAKVAEGRQLTSRYNKDEWESHEIHDFNENDFMSYMKEVKRNVNYAVKEFEMKKAAFRYTRAETAKTGSIDVNKLWSYKTNEDIFSRVTRLADAKNHGMFMLIDFSGSMSGVMHRVLDQLIHLVVFCKTVNIPFDVYGFTTANPNFTQDYRVNDSPEGQVHHEGLSLCQQISSELGKKDYNDALKFLYHRKNQEASWRGMRIYEYGSKYEDWGSTPLNTSLVAIHDKLFNMITAKGIDNMNLVVLTDGDTNNLKISNNIPKEFEPSKISRGFEYYADYKIKLGRGSVRSTRSGTPLTKELLNYYRKFGITTLGFFLANDRYAYNYKLSDVCYDKNDQDRYENEEFTKDAQRQNTKNKCVIYNDALGYDEFYIVQTFNKQVMNIDNEDFQVSDDATKAQITQAFKKHSKGKKLNKTLLTNFGKAVAV